MPSRPQVLVVDDDAAMREMLACMLGCLGFEASTAVDADEALFALRGRSFDVVVSDVHMPRRDGFELARALRWVRPGTPLVLMSSFASPQSPAEAARAGAGAFLSKPFSSGRLAQAIEQARGAASASR